MRRLEALRLPANTDADAANARHEMLQVPAQAKQSRELQALS